MAVGQLADRNQWRR